ESRMPVIVEYMDRLVAENTKRLVSKPANDPLIVRTYETNREVTDGEFRTGLVSVLSEDGKVVTNPDRNTVIVYDHQSQFKSISTFSAAIDAEPQQVMLTSKLCEITLDDYIGYGLQIFTDHGAQNLDNGRFTGNSFGTSASTVGQLFGAPSGFGP